MKKIISSLCAVFAVFFVFAGSPVNATLVSLNDSVFGSDSITHDSVSGLEWLDVKLTTNISYNDMVNQFGIGGDFEGFRHANTDEIRDLLTINLPSLTTSIPNTPLFQPGDFYADFQQDVNGEANTLAQLLSVFNVDVNGVVSQSTQGVYDRLVDSFCQTCGTNVHSLAAIIFDANPNSINFGEVLVTMAGGASDEFASNQFGHFLVREFSPIPEPNIIISVASYDFGNVNIGNTSTPQTFTISNTGDADLIIGTIGLTGADASEFDFQNDVCSAQIIAPSGTCTINVTFSPTSSGAKSANLYIPSDDPDTPVLNVPLSGKGKPYPGSGGGGGGNKETNCTDEIDNDSDGLIDCEDRDCRKDPACTN